MGRNGTEMMNEHLQENGHDIYCPCEGSMNSAGCDCARFAQVRADERLRVAKLLLDSVDHE